MDLNLGRTVNHATDCVWLQEMQVSGVVGPDAWHRSGRPQPIHISVKVPVDFEEAGILDDINGTVHYGKLAKSIMDLFKDQAASFESLDELVEEISKRAMLESVQATSLELMIKLPEALLLADGLGLATYVNKVYPPPGIEEETRLQGMGSKLFVERLRLNCIIGVNPHERLEKQPVVVDLDFWKFDKVLLVAYADTIKKISLMIEDSCFETLEALANSIAKKIVLYCPVKMVTVSVSKPRAITGVNKAGVTVTRTRDFYDRHTNGTLTPH